MTHKLKYLRFRESGYPASHALSAARTLESFERLEYDDCVKVEAIPEEESYFSVFGNPDGYTDIHGRIISAGQERDQIASDIDRRGCWVVGSYWRISPDDEWQLADSVGMCVGYDDPCSPFENWYVLDLMRAALDAYNAQAFAPNL